MADGKMISTNNRLVTIPLSGQGREQGAECDQRVLERLHRHARIHRLRRRQVLPPAGPECIYVIYSGLITAENTGVPSRRSIVELLYPGDIVSSALMRVTPGLSYMAVAASEVWRISVGALRAEMAHDDALLDYVIQRLNMQRARMQLHITALAGLTSEQRVAALILQAAYRLGRTGSGGVSFDMPLSRNEVADYLSLNADTLSRIMSRLVRENVLHRSSRVQITVRDVQALKAYCPISDAVSALHAAGR